MSSISGEVALQSLKSEVNRVGDALTAVVIKVASGISAALNFTDNFEKESTNKQPVGAGVNYLQRG